MSDEQWRMPNGRHKGLPISRVPVSYLKWMVGSRHSEAARAEAELKRRGTVTPTLEVSGHAIDRASLRCRKQWHASRGENEGLHAWLCRVSAEALAEGRQHGTEPGRVEYQGLSFRFELDGVWPVLKSVLPQKVRQKGART